jgi:hypothetical protein
MTSRVIGLGVALTLSLAAAAVAQTPSSEARDASRVHELAVMLESVTLRCKLIGIDRQAKFQTFTARQKRGLTGAKEALMRHFEAVAKADMNREIDRFYIRTYNFYGTGRTDQEVCNSFAELMDILAEPDADAALLTRVAEIMVPDPMLDAYP